MAENTTIEWCDHTFSTWIGCTKISPACDNCYAANFGNRFGIEWGAGKTRKRTSKSTWKQPLRWNREAEKVGTRPRVFCASLADVFDNEVPSEWRAELFGLIRDTPYLDWLLLTKRIGNAHNMIIDAMSDIMQSTREPMPNVWLGATICNQEEADRDIPKLLATPAAKRFVSIEPMLGAIDLTPYIKNINWVICGGESGKNARPMHPYWVRSLRDQCADADVPFLFKQWGEWTPYVAGETNIDKKPCRTYEEPHKFMVKVGKKQAGRLLDGVIHNEFPRSEQ